MVGADILSSDYTMPIRPQAFIYLSFYKSCAYSAPTEYQGQYYTIILFNFFPYTCEVGIRLNHMKLLIFNDF